MGGCMSDTKGGQQGVGGNQPRHFTMMSQGGGAAADTGTGGHNDAVDLFFRSRGLDSLFTQLELSISASKLRDLDILSKSDPMAVVYAKKRDGTLEEIGRTEVILNTLNPVWIQKVSIAYQFETVQSLVFRVYDVDTKFHNIPVKMLKLKEQEFLGEASCVLSEIVTKHNKSLTLNLQGKNVHGGMKNIGNLTVHAEESVDSRQAVELTFHCSHLENKDLFSKSDPFLRISKIVESGESVPICKTEVVNNNLNPTWKPANPLVIECFDFNSSGNHGLIGKLQTSVAGLEKLHNEKNGANFHLPSSHREAHVKVLKSQLYVERFLEKSQYTFLDYISSGFELNFMVAVDFTASNGNPRFSDSLHYIDPSGRFNAYQQAIFEVGEVIQFYDYDKRFPAWGFGGKLTTGGVSHCFNLNGNANMSEVEGVNGILAAYSSCLHNVALAGPTLFGPVVNAAAHIASQSLSHNQNKYFVLLIITDGVLTDLQETKDALVRASDLPLSILIVGVGGADFKEMEILDADSGKRLESYTGRVATRDIVQFVPMREVHGGQISIVQSLLEELPSQFLMYMRSRDIKPRSVNEAQTSGCDLRWKSGPAGNPTPIGDSQSPPRTEPNSNGDGDGGGKSDPAPPRPVAIPTKNVEEKQQSGVSLSYAAYHFGSSGMAVTTATGVTHPLDVLKVRLQMQLVGQRAPLTGLGKLFSQIMKIEGPGALYLGLTPALTRSVLYGGLRLSLYEPSKYVCEWASGTSNILVKIASGAFSGAIATALTNPAEVLKVRLQMNPNLGREGAIREMQKIASEEGIRALWKGVGPAMARAAALTASQLATYDEAKQALIRWTPLEEGFHLHLISSTIAGTVSTLVTAPVDMIKTRLMLQRASNTTGSYKNGFHCAYQVVSTEGPRALYKGEGLLLDGVGNVWLELQLEIQRALSFTLWIQGFSMASDSEEFHVELNVEEIRHRDYVDIMDSLLPLPQSDLPDLAAATPASTDATGAAISPASTTNFTSIVGLLVLLCREVVLLLVKLLTRI
ncbi:C2 calcium-dependent membrane targeting [Macleaya cordata]|uniref:C2 calcium-dependent membrane targeting n=1 Tax=Macleaya cordata TaxID=56857 RepID=A0A200Q1N3_MACCD|nr:C2 calcium-dependent membrane targeting [Macleaya cordata]